MAWWKLKPEADIDPHKALSIQQEDILDFVNITLLEDGYEITEIDKEYIFNEVRKGIFMGQINDWDWKSEQKLEATN